jgi:hypothetical protein
MTTPNLLPVAVCHPSLIEQAGQNAPPGLLGVVPGAVARPGLPGQFRAPGRVEGAQLGHPRAVGQGYLVAGEPVSTVPSGSPNRWAPSDGEGDKIFYIFDCGFLGGDETRIRLEDRELDRWEWVPAGKIADYVIPRLRGARRRHTAVSRTRRRSPEQWI